MNDELRGFIDRLILDRLATSPANPSLGIELSDRLKRAAKLHGLTVEPIMKGLGSFINISEITGDDTESDRFVIYDVIAGLDDDPELIDMKVRQYLKTVEDVLEYPGLYSEEAIVELLGKLTGATSESNDAETKGTEIENNSTPTSEQSGGTKPVDETGESGGLTEGASTEDGKSETPTASTVEKDSADLNADLNVKALVVPDPEKKDDSATEKATEKSEDKLGNSDETGGSDDANPSLEFIERAINSLESRREMMNAVHLKEGSVNIEFEGLPELLLAALVSTAMDNRGLRESEARTKLLEEKSANGYGLMLNHSNQNQKLVRNMLYVMGLRYIGIHVTQAEFEMLFEKVAPEMRDYLREVAIPAWAAPTDLHQINFEAMLAALSTSIENCRQLLLMTVAQQVVESAGISANDLDVQSYSDKINSSPFFARREDEAIKKAVDEIVARTMLYKNKGIYKQ